MPTNPLFARNVDDLKTKLEARGFAYTQEFVVVEADETQAYIRFESLDNNRQRIEFDIESITVRQACATAVSLNGLPYAGTYHNEAGHRETIYRR